MRQPCFGYALFGYSPGDSLQVPSYHHAYRRMSQSRSSQYVNAHITGSYFHINGLIHRDVKAANLLLDEDGTVLLGDLGVAAFLWDSEEAQGSKPRTINFQPDSHQRSVSAPVSTPKPSILGKRKSFVGTPCWMAPEVIKGKQYDASADIWSFGITAIELAQGRAPRSRMNPNQVLLSTVRDGPPHLERTGGQYKYSAAFVDIVDKCLNKDPAKRPTATELLQLPFFKGARKPNFLVNKILRDLPALTKRQERRKQPSIYTHATMESWDFSSSTPSSPTTSIYSHMRRPTSLLPQESVFEVEDDSPAPSGDAGTAGADGDDEDDHAGIEGRSKAEAYAVRIRQRQRSSIGRTLHSHSRSGSFQSLHSHHSHHHTSHTHPHPHTHGHNHSHARHLSYEEPRSTVHSIQEVAVVTDESSESEEASDSPRSPEGATLGVPAPAAPPSASPALSTHSSTSASSASSPLGPGTPPSTTHASAGRSRTLWRKLASKLEAESDKERDATAAPPSVPPHARKRSFGAVLGRTALVGADLVRTASRTMSGEWCTGLAS